MFFCVTTLYLGSTFSLASLGCVLDVLVPSLLASLFKLHLSPASSQSDPASETARLFEFQLYHPLTGYHWAKFSAFLPIQILPSACGPQAIYVMVLDFDHGHHLLCLPLLRLWHPSPGK